jgi:hypothetical protein
VERAMAERQPLIEARRRYAHWFVLAVLVAAADPRTPGSSSTRRAPCG